MDFVSTPLLPYLVTENKFQPPIQLSQNHIAIFHKKIHQNKTHTENVTQIIHKTAQLGFLPLNNSDSNACILYKHHVEREQTTYHAQLSYSGLAYFYLCKSTFH